MHLLLPLQYFKQRLFVDDVCHTMAYMVVSLFCITVCYWYITGICATVTQKKNHVGMQCCASSLTAFTLSNKMLTFEEPAFLYYLTGAIEVN